MKTPWWKLVVFAAAVPVLIVVAAWAEREARAKEARRRVAKLAEDEVGCDTGEPWDR